MMSSIFSGRLSSPGVWLAAFLPLTLAGQVSEAGPIDDFYKLESQIAEAQEVFLAAVQDRALGVDKLSDPRLPVLLKMDALTFAFGPDSVDDGAAIAIGTFFWSWNLDLDLPCLVIRFDIIAKRYADHPGVDDILNQASDIATATNSFGPWSRSLESLAKRTQRTATKIGATMALGRVHLAAKNVNLAKQAFGRIARVAGDDKDAVELAKGYIFEADHLQIGMTAPGFTAQTLDGKSVTLKSLRGQVVLLNFWASW